MISRDLVRESETLASAGERRVAEAIGRQAMTMAYNSPWHNTSSPAASLAAKLTSLAPPGFNKVFFTTGGSTATDTALQVRLEWDFALNSRRAAPY